MTLPKVTLQVGERQPAWSPVPSTFKKARTLAQELSALQGRKPAPQTPGRSGPALLRPEEMSWRGASSRHCQGHLSPALWE